MARGHLARVVVLAAAAAALAACDRTASDGVRVGWNIDEGTVSSTSTRVRVSLHNGRSLPISGAVLTLEGHMAHPGMAPLTSPAPETSAGLYEGGLRFSMGGDWTLVVSGTLPDGTRLVREQRIEIRGAAPAS
jgi:hypothetical protein